MSERPRVSKMDAARGVVQEHITRLIESLAGFGLTESQIEILLNKEFHRLFRGRKD